MVRKKVRKNDMIAEACVRLLSVSGQKTARLPAEIVGCGTDQRPPQSTWGDEGGSTHLAFFLVRGRARYLGGDHEMKFGAGDLFVVPRGNARKFQVGSVPLLLCWFHLHVESVWKPLEGRLPYRQQAENTQLIHAIIERLLTDQLAVATAENEGNRLLAQTLFHYLKKELLPEMPVADACLLRRLTPLWDAVRAQLQLPWSVTEMSARVYMSEGHFIRTVKRLYSQAPMQMVTRMRMEHAAMRLRTTNLLVDEVASEVGYASAHAFSDVFLRHMGKRPGQFRK